MMESKQKIKRLIFAAIIVIAAIAAVMEISFVRGNGSGEEIQPKVVSADYEMETVMSVKESTNEKPVSNDEALGKVTGEDDDFTLTVDPANFDVTIVGFDRNITLLTSSEEVLHDQMKEWLDENEFWDMTEVVYAGKYMRDETTSQTTLYFRITRYPNSPLMATWNPDTGKYIFSIDWR